MSSEQLNEIPHALLHDIEKNDRRFRLFQTIFFVLVSVMLAVLLIGNFQQSKSSQKVIETQGKTLDRLSNNSKQRTAQINDLQKHIDCVVALLQHSNRSKLVISDTESCDINSLENDNVKPSPSINSSLPSTKTIPSKTKSNSTTKSPTKKPVKLLGVSVCVPFTHLCIES